MEIIIIQVYRIAQNLCYSPAWGTYVLGMDWVDFSW